jgi:sec-independent protein translocase protein TatA
MPLLAGIGPLGVPELLIIAFIVILVFGVGRLPEVGGALGKGIREFRKSTRDDETAPSAATAGGAIAASSGAGGGSTEAASTPDVLFCRECGARNPGGSKFCAECGKTITAAVG